MSSLKLAAAEGMKALRCIIEGGLRRGRPFDAERIAHRYEADDGMLILLFIVGDDQKLGEEVMANGDRHGCLRRRCNVGAPT